MKTQIIKNDNGRPTGVFIPIEQWPRLKVSVLILKGQVMIFRNGKRIFWMRDWNSKS